MLHSSRRLLPDRNLLRRGKKRLRNLGAASLLCGRLFWKWRTEWMAGQSEIMPTTSTPINHFMRTEWFFRSFFYSFENCVSTFWVSLLLLSKTMTRCDLVTNWWQDYLLKSCDSLFSYLFTRTIVNLASFFWMRVCHSNGIFQEPKRNWIFHKSFPNFVDSFHLWSKLYLFCFYVTIFQATFSRFDESKSNNSQPIWIEKIQISKRKIHKRFS